MGWEQQRLSPVPGAGDIINSWFGGFEAFQLSRFWALTLDPLQRVMLLLPYQSTTECLPQRKKILSSPAL